MFAILVKQELPILVLRYNPWPLIIKLILTYLIVQFLYYVAERYKVIRGQHKR